MSLLSSLRALAYMVVSSVVPRGVLPRGALRYVRTPPGNVPVRQKREEQKETIMPRYIIELTSGSQRQMEYEAFSEAEALRHFIAHHSPFHECLVERTEIQYKGWKKFELSIGPGVCDQCFEPSDTKICADCVKASQFECEECGNDFDLDEQSEREWVCKTCHAKTVTS